MEKEVGVFLKKSEDLIEDLNDEEINKITIFAEMENLTYLIKNIEIPLNETPETLCDMFICANRTELITRNYIGTIGEISQKEYDDISEALGWDAYAIYQELRNTIEALICDVRSAYWKTVGREVAC